jgi:hypothetical protein
MMKGDDLLSRLKELCRCMSYPPGKCFSCQAISRIEELEAEVASLKPDAERYRYQLWKVYVDDFDEWIDKAREGK